MRPAHGILSANNQSITPQIVLDRSNVPMVNYGDNIGLQRNPLTVAKFALTYYDDYLKSGNDTFKKAFLNSTNWLLNDSVSHGNRTILEYRLTYPPYSLVNKTVYQGNYSILEYKFPYPLYGLAAPWISAMAQGETLPVLTRAYEITGNGKYLELAKQVLNSFFVEVEDGGVSYKTPHDGWWYEEYAGNRITGTGILSGMMYTVLRIHDYYNLTKDSTAKYLFEQGVLSLTKNLSRYDYKNGTSSYDDLLGHVSFPTRLKTNVSYLDQLYHLTKQPVFKLYHDKWGISLKQ
ncbi:MAG: hypothetical protein DLM72_11205 [Candidatus Nitrosopolaris wilkensis]|nr:MAG: hypothetical protein DLM72_11205 [Candidatus Nitrosopolaris wilkensis]